MKIGESIFDPVYLIVVITLGILMVRKAGNKGQYKLFGIMAIVLGCGDAFHLVPRVYSMWSSGGLEGNAAMLGFGQAVTSVTMTVFYVLLYHVWEMRYQVKERGARYAVYVLAAIRVILCLFPQNDWLSKDAPLSWGIYRNIPFAILGLLIVVLFFQKAREHKDKAFQFMWLAILISFACYAPVVLLAKSIPAMGAFMIPKTCAYVWIVAMGYLAMKKEA